MSDIQSNKAIARRYVEEVQNQHDIDALETIFSANFVDHSASHGGIYQGIEGLKRGYVQLLNAFPDLRATILDQIGEGDKVVTYKRIAGTHRSTFQGIPATSNKIDFEIIDIFRIEHNLIAESWLVFDELKLLRQLGAISDSRDI